MSDKNKKRESGTGSFRLKPNGTVEYRVLHEGIPKSFTGKNETECRRKYRDWQKELIIVKQVEQVKKNEQITLIDYIYYWLDSKTKLKSSSRQRLVSTINHQILPYSIAQSLLNELTPNQINDYLVSLSQEYSRSTVLKVYNIIKPVISRASKYKIIDIDISDEIEVPPESEFKNVPKKEITIYTKEEMKALTKAVYDNYLTNKRRYRYAPIYVLILNTGMRLGEIHALQWDAVDLENDVIHVFRSAMYIPESVVVEDVTYSAMILTDVKTRSSDRFIPINAQAKRALLELRARQEVDEIETDYVLCNLMGGMMQFRTVQDVFKCICEDIGIEYKGIHALRHTFASILIENNIDIGLVSGLMGHSSYKITYDTYVHYINEQKAKAIGCIDLF